MREIINIVLYIFATFVCTLFYNLYYAMLNNQKMKFGVKNIIFTLMATLLLLLNITYNIVDIKIIVNIIIFCIEWKLIFKSDYKKIVVTYIVVFLMLTIIEIILTNTLFCSGILSNNNSANSVTDVNLLLTVLVGLNAYLILLIPYIREKIKKLIAVFANNLNILNITYLIFVTIVIIGMINIKYFATSNSIQLIFLLIMIFMFLFILVIHSKTNELILKNSNKKLINYNDKYSKFLDEYKIYKHNIKNKLIAIKTYGNKKVNALIEDLLEEETNFSIKNNNLYNIPNGIRGIVAEKLYNANFNVIINNKIKNDPFKYLSPKNFNSISESIGIVLDNAIEASEETKQPIIIMDLYEDTSYLYLKVGNNYCNSIDLDDIGSKYYSTKNRGRGLGLFSIRRNSLVKEKISIINDFYFIELKIKKGLSGN